VFIKENTGLVFLLALFPFLIFLLNAFSFMPPGLQESLLNWFATFIGGEINSVLERVVGSPIVVNKTEGQSSGVNPKLKERDSRDDPF
jgi:uncharacterized BrkB/YihY/UPF0761 family membrane protein